MEIELVQGSQEWLDFRLNKIGASQIAAIMGLSPFSSRIDVYNEIKGLKTKSMTKSMQRGKDFESEALSVLETETGFLLRPAVFQNDELPWAFASLDGISLNEDLIAEIKVPGKNSFENMRREIPVYYQYQMQWQMLVTGIKKNIFMVYSENEFYMHSLDYDPILAEKLLECGRDFYENHILPCIPPEPEEDEPVFCDDPVFLDLQEKYVLCDACCKQFEATREKYKKAIIENFFDDTAVKGKLLVIKNQSRKGALDENAMLSDGIDLNKYRKASVNFPVIKLLKEEKNDSP